MTQEVDGDAASFDRSRNTALNRCARRQILSRTAWGCRPPEPPGVDAGVVSTHTGITCRVNTSRDVGMKVGFCTMPCSIQVECRLERGERSRAAARDRDARCFIEQAVVRGYRDAWSIRVN